MNIQALDEVEKLFHDFTETHHDAVALTILAARALLVVPGVAELSQKMTSLPWWIPRRIRRSVGIKKQDAAEVTKIAEFAQKEIDKGFPFLYGQATVSLWGYIEAFVEDLLIVSLEHEPSLLNTDRVPKVKITLTLYEQMNSVERKQYILDTLQREHLPKFKQSIDKFEELFNIFGLGEPLDDNVRRSLLELANMRNNLVHQRGVIDRKLVDACPWLKLSTGDTIIMDGADFYRYGEAVAMYAATICKRVVLHFGGSTNPIDTYMRELPTKRYI